MNTLLLHDGAHLAYQVEGPRDAPALTFVNSLGTDMRLWEPQAIRLSKYYRVLRYDIRGHGTSSLGDGPMTIEQLGRDLRSLLDHLEMERTHICGISLGGMVALWLAACHPERIGRAIFANTGARIGTPVVWESRVAAVRRGGIAAIREQVVARFLGEEFRAWRPDLTEAVGDMLLCQSAAGYIAACMLLQETDLHPIIPSIRAPSLIIAGTRDEATPPYQAAELQAAITGSCTAMLDAAHLSNVEQPDVFTDHVIRFLGTAEETGSASGPYSERGSLKGLSNGTNR
jgi:3-oxoadipate enol-lactonase